jgi:hemerythrin-like metal-binding protein
VERFDEDHQHLCAMLNELHEAVQAGKGKALLRQVLLGLSAYSEQHFQSEEGAMRRTGYVDYEAHAAEHMEFSARVREFARAQEIGDTGLALEVLVFMREWLEHHILVTDQKYADHLNANGVW